MNPRCESSGTSVCGCIAPSLALAEPALANVATRRTVLKRSANVTVSQLELEPHEGTVGSGAHHTVSLNLGLASVLGLSADGLAWSEKRLAHHAVSVWPAGTLHRVRRAEPASILLVEIEVGFAAAVLGAASLRSKVASHDVFAKHILLALAEHAKAAGSEGTAVVAELTRVLLVHLATRGLALDTAARPPRPGALASPKLGRVLKHIDENLDSAMPVDTLAELVNMDGFRFTRAFKEATGCSPHRYVLETRISRAKELLRDRALSITEIALQTGFATPSHFAVTFRRVTKLAPSEFREGG